MYRKSLLVIAALACLTSPLRAQVDPELSVGISELCTVCNDVIRCERDARLDGPEIVVYNLLEDTVWQQIATIWDYLIQFISPKTDDVRAMVIYELKTAGTATPRVIPDQEATVDAATLSIRMPDDIEVDQTTGRWWRELPGGEEQELGRCTLLDFTAGRELLEELNPGAAGDDL